MKFSKKIFFFFLIVATLEGYAQNTLDVLGLDNTTPAAGVYSLRKLSSSYVGSAIQVRRSTDNTTQNIGFDSNGNLDTNSLTSFVGSGDGFLTIWYDQSGTGNNAIQNALLNQPKIITTGVIERANGLPTIIFSGSQFLVVTSTSFNNDLTGCLIYKASSLNTGSGSAETWYFMNGIFGSEQSGGTTDFAYGIYNNKFTAGNGGTPDNSVAGNTTVNDNAIRLHSWTRNSTTGQINLYENGTNDGTANFNTGIRLAVPSVAIGANQTFSGGQIFYNGNVSELILFAAVLTTQRQTIENNQRLYYISCAPPTISSFNNTTKTYFDTNYTIVPPLSNSSGVFTYTSSNLSVATISGTTVNIIGPGSTTITANQDSDGSFCIGSISSTLTVNAISVLTKNGQVSTTDLKYINKNGAVGGDFGVNKNGLSVQTKSYDLLTGLVMNLDAGNPASYPGTGTTWTDVSGLGNNGTLVNNPVYNSSNGGNLVFNGSNTYVNAPLIKTASCTFSVWTKSTSATNMLFNAGNDGSGPDLFFWGGKVSWNTWDSDSNPFGIIPATAANGNWHNYVVVNDAVSNTARLYYDGVLYGTTAGYRNASANTNLYIGGSNGEWPWAGAIGNFQVYNRVLSPAEIIQNFNNLKSRYGL
ncbi:hypothetical protein FQU23_013020 [Flavobacterium sp. XN-5]|uniref:LamG domain-containing protein n=1 Tax=Flavobacterium sp. XN-5 TaxID=2599390 RepID=UPI0011CC55FE|nr:LamG domain-containing protein [Flavobacterium sp. XN-5]NGY38430.1 hypothetical protein [Flavobacterium sp. XN-5]